MTFKGLEIGIPTLQQIEIYIAEKGFYFSPEEFYEHYSKRNWLTLKGTPIKRLEAAIDSFNGSKILKETKKQPKGERKKKEKRMQKLRRIAFSKICLENKKNYSNEHRPIPYSEQLKDVRWHHYRSAVIEYYHHRCVSCGKRENLQVHHIKYKRGRYAWEYNFDDVVVLCKECHSKEHDITLKFL